MSFFHGLEVEFIDMPGNIVCKALKISGTNFWFCVIKRTVSSPEIEARRCGQCCVLVGEISV